MKKIPWNKGKKNVYSDETKKKWSLIRKGKKHSEQHKKNMAIGKKISNEKKRIEISQRKCNINPDHIPYTNKRTGNYVWLKDIHEPSKFVCGKCSANQKYVRKFATVEKLNESRKLRMQKDNPMFDKNTRKKLSLSRTGVKLGPMHSDEHKEKLRQNWIKQNPSRNGISSKQRDKISKTRIERFKNGTIQPTSQKKGRDSALYGVPRPENVRKAIGLAHKDKVLSEETKAKLREARKNQKNIGQSGTIPEFQAQIILEELGISYRADVPGIVGRPDILIGEKHVIFVDGIFTHACSRSFRHRGQICPGYLPEQKIIGKKTAKMIWEYDAKVTDTLINEGFYVLRLWEDELRYDPELVIDKIQSFLKK